MSRRMKNNQGVVMESKQQRALLMASVAGLMAAAGLASMGQVHAADEAAKVPCYGINKCQGAGNCGGKGHSCQGKNACAGQGYLTLDKETCLKIKDGRLTSEPVKS